ncbi:ATP-binding protein, partial [Actinomadura rubrisoli]
MLWGREAQRARLERLVVGAREGRGGALVLRGEAGIGKTALLDEAADAAVRSVAEGTGGRSPAEDALRVLRATGVEAETALPFAALQMALRPVLSRLDGLPEAQAAALRAALGYAQTTPHTPRNSPAS